MWLDTGQGNLLINLISLIRSKAALYIGGAILIAIALGAAWLNGKSYCEGQQAVKTIQNVKVKNANSDKVRRLDSNAKRDSLLKWATE